MFGNWATGKVANVITPTITVRIVCDAKLRQTDSKRGGKYLENRVQRSRGDKPVKEPSKLFANDLVKV